MAEVTFRSVSKQYKGDGPLAVDALDLAIEDGEFMVLVGPSGCGKSTALRMIAGLEEITDGELQHRRPRRQRRAAGRPRHRDGLPELRAVPAHDRSRQHRLRARDRQGATKAEIKQRTEDAAEMLGLTEYLDRLPKALSGGQRQRVAMGRAIVRSPQVFLMDEPLSNLDAKLRVQMRSEIIQIQKRLGTTMVYVTHDQVEAMTMGHRVAVMRKGLAAAGGTAPGAVPAAGQPVRRGLHRQPGHEPDQRHARRDSPSGPTVTFAEHTAGHRPDERSSGIRRIAERIGSPVIVGLRPEHFVMAGDCRPPGRPDDHARRRPRRGDGRRGAPARRARRPPVEIDGTPVAAEEGDEDRRRRRRSIIARVDGIHVVRRPATSCGSA